jgi:hypothetical protein
MALRLPARRDATQVVPRYHDDPDPRAVARAQAAARRAARERTRWLWIVPLAAGFAAVLGWTFAHDSPGRGLSDRGFATIILAGLAVVDLIEYRSSGGRWWWLRPVGDYAVVAALAVLLVTAPTAKNGHHARPAPPPAALASALDGTGCPGPTKYRAFLACWLYRAAAAADDSPTQGGR